jgi:hypothetical protein
MSSDNWIANTDSSELTAAIDDFEAEFPGFWWSVGQCSVGAHASCAVDGAGIQRHLLNGIEAGHPYDDGFHCDTVGGSPADALRNILDQVRQFMKATA